MQSWVVVPCSLSKFSILFVRGENCVADWKITNHYPELSFLSIHILRRMNKNIQTSTWSLKYTSISNHLLRSELILSWKINQSKSTIRKPQSNKHSLLTLECFGFRGLFGTVYELYNLRHNLEMLPTKWPNIVCRLVHLTDQSQSTDN